MKQNDSITNPLSFHLHYFSEKQICQEDFVDSQIINNDKDDLSDQTDDNTNNNITKENRENMYYNNCINNSDYYSNKRSKDKNQLFNIEKCAFKGKYNIKTREIKLQCLYDLKTMNPRQVAEKYKISIRNIHRWKVKGENRKKGSGRLFRDPDLYTKVYYWYLNQPIGSVTAQGLIAVAKELSVYKKFQASHGWLTKFMNHYKDQIYLLKC